MMVAGTSAAAEKVVRSSWILRTLIRYIPLIRLSYRIRCGCKTKSRGKDGLKVSAVDTHTLALPST